MSARADKTAHLSDIDKKLLKILLSPNGYVHSQQMAKEMAKDLGIPIITIRRRRHRLESEFIKSNYVLDIEKFGWRRVDFFFQ